MRNDLKRHMAAVFAKNAADISAYFKERPHATRESCAFYLGISVSTVNRHVKHVKKSNAENTRKSG